MKDKIIINIESQIIAKQKLLKDNYKLLKQNVKENEYLKELLVEYEKYNDTLIQEQNMQIEAFDLLQKHIDSILEENLSKNDIKNLNREKKEIIAELNKLK